MTHLFISPNNEYPRHIGDVKLQHPSYQEGTSLPVGWHPVTLIEQPEIGVDEITEEMFPELTETGYVQKWNVRALTEEEIARREEMQNQNPFDMQI
jgi:hypothetical protein